MPEKRMNSTPLFMAICFSPTTIRLPFGSTSDTVTPIVPVKAFDAVWVSPSANLVPVLVAILPPRRPCSGPGTPTLTLPDLLPVLAPLLLAAVFSTMLIVRMSPMWRARRSSNIGRNVLAL